MILRLFYFVRKFLGFHKPDLSESFEHAIKQNKDKENDRL